MNILYIAYSCDPYNGSEDKIGWNVPLKSSSENNVFVITKKEHERAITHYLEENPNKNLHFSFVDIPAVYKKVFKGFFYSGRLNRWHRNAFPVAERIVEEEKIDIIHQITPIEFRSIGNYGKIKNCKFICGPIAGGQRIPKGLRYYLKAHKTVEIVRSCVNCGYRFYYKVSRKLEKCDYLLFANQETKAYLRKACPPRMRTGVITDVSVDIRDLRQEGTLPRKTGEKIRFLVVGRLVYLKGHEFLLDSMRRIPKELPFECCVVGSGRSLKKLREKTAEYGLSDRISFVGAVPHTQIRSVYEQADVLIMPSFREATGSVLLEAMAQGLPVITINRFGAANILDSNVGWVYDGEDREAFVESLKNILLACIRDPEEVRRRGNNARKYAEKYTWEHRTAYYQSLYHDLLNQ